MSKEWILWGEELQPFHDSWAYAVALATLLERGDLTKGEANAYLRKLDKMNTTKNEIDALRAFVRGWLVGLEERLRETLGEEASSTPLFSAVVGNPPYQIETSVATTKAQATTVSVFQDFQLTALKIASITSMIYPGGRWIQRGGKGMRSFGDFVLSSPYLTEIYFTPFESDSYPFDKTSAGIQDGVAIVLFDQTKENNGVIDFNGESISLPGKNLLPIDPRFISITSKMRRYNSINHRASSQKLYGVESNWVEQNPDKVLLLKDTPIPPPSMKDPVKLLTNNKGGKSGRPTWYWVEREEIPLNRDKIDKWQFVIKSAQFAHEREQIEKGAIIDDNSAFGRSKICIGEFDTKEEVMNFEQVMQTQLFTRLYHQSLNGGLSGINHFVPDLLDYSNANPIFQSDEELRANFSPEDPAYSSAPFSDLKLKAHDFIGLDLSHRLYKLFGLSEEEISLVEAS